LLDELTSWHSEWSELRVVVVGVGATGFALVDTLVELGCDVVSLARDAADDVLPILEVLGATSVVGASDSELVSALEKFAPDLVIVSPGVRKGEALVQAALAANIPVWSDIDFAWRVRDKRDQVSPWILIAGEENGPRIAELSARLLSAAGLPSLVVGHHAGVLLDALRDPNDYATIVIVASDTQVHNLARGESVLRSPTIALCVEENPSSSLAGLYDGVSQACMYRRGAGPTMSLVAHADVQEGARAIGIGFDSPGRSDLGLVQGIVVDRAFLEDRDTQALEVSTLEELTQAGWTIPEDLPIILGAIAVARGHNVSPAVIAGVLTLPSGGRAERGFGVP
jgi:UDP-N-acetylmuramoylalanine--D-glutamate ligase